MATQIIKGKAFKRMLDAKQVSPKAIEVFDDVVMRLAREIKLYIKTDKGRITDEDIIFALQGKLNLTPNTEKPSDRWVDVE